MATPEQSSVNHRRPARQDELKQVPARKVPPVPATLQPCIKDTSIGPAALRSDLSLRDGGETADQNRKLWTKGKHQNTTQVTEKRLYKRSYERLYKRL